MASIPCFIANWKMNKTVTETASYLSDFIGKYAELSDHPPQVIIAPSFTSLSIMANTLKEQGSKIALAAQNLHFEPSGAFTGEISAEMLCAAGCDYVIIGHSERRNLFGETDEMVHRKLLSARKAGLIPIICIGESLKDRHTEKTWPRLQGQLSAVLTDDIIKSGLAENISDWLIAYEPVWAIGTGETPEPDEVADVHRQIQGFIENTAGKGSPRILYGGSVSEKNIETFMKPPEIGGVLVGGASLSAETFFKMIALATNGT